MRTAPRVWTPKHGRLLCPGWANSCAAREGFGQGEWSTQAWGVAAVTCGDHPLQQVNSKEGGGEGDLKLLLHLPRALGARWAQQYMGHKDHDPSKQQRSGGWWPLVTGEGTGPGGGQKFRCLRSLGGRACMYVRPCMANWLQPPKRAGEASKVLIPF